MAEYIEREAAVSMVCKGCNKEFPNEPCEPTECHIQQGLLAIPAADVVEVRHGVWCLVEYEYLTCSECGESYYTGCESTAEAKERLQNGEVPNYCPNCGAKMGKGEGE